MFWARKTKMLNQSKTQSREGATLLVDNAMTSILQLFILMAQPTLFLELNTVMFCKILILSNDITLYHTKLLIDKTKQCSFCLVSPDHHHYDTKNKHIKNNRFELTVLAYYRYVRKMKKNNLTSQFIGYKVKTSTNTGRVAIIGIKSVKNLS